jgi:DNA-binding IclR family transcriptional regulator
MSKDYEVPAIRRAGEILNFLASRSGPVPAAELREASGLAKSSFYLVMASLEHRRWIEKKKDGYIIGIDLYVLGTAYLRHDGLQDAFRAAAVKFVDKHSEVVQLAVLDGADVVYIAREDARRPIRLMSDLGSRLPAHACGLGKVLLANLSDEEVAAALPARLKPITDRTITNRDALMKELRAVRRTGLGLDLEEVAAGLVCFAAYVGETPLGKKVAVSTSVPVDRLDDKRRKRIEAGILQVAHEISRTCSAFSVSP